MVQLHLETLKKLFKDGDAFPAKTLGFHTTASGRRYEVQFDSDGKMARGVLHAGIFHLGKADQYGA
jgi:hypothetical protein